ncbi:Outer membrane efflux protein [Stieleria varia]|uniref:Outer membrane efflux protein n=2 Tax=Stieleria varia TaxID=2528005 RepID=A0A5C6A039_9BACT|nr:Outer membrane efflux protein [Stieleria varia]
MPYWAARAMITVVLMGLISLGGCTTYHTIPQSIGNNTDWVDAIMADVDAGAPPEELPSTQMSPMTIRTVDEFNAVNFRDLSLQETLSIALNNTAVLRDLGASVLRNPDQIGSGFAKPLARLDPQVGTEAALAMFDAQFYALGSWENNDRRFNNRFFGGGSNAFKQDVNDYVFQMSKRTTTGAELAVRSVIDYDANNATGNLLDSAWQTQIHLEARQPLLQGGGLEFNRIAGPAARPGVYSGVLVAKVNQDITNAKFEQGMRDYLSDVINAYWDLYFAYRDLDAKRDATERSLQTWRSYEAQRSSSRKSGAAEALSREQYYRFRSDLQNAIAGQLAQRTRNSNAASGGAFAGVGGVQAAERRLRLLIGIAINDGSLLRPLDEPSQAPVRFDWDSISVEAIQLRSELQQQRLKIKRREMEVLAAKNYLMPQLDLVTIYRMRGLDKRLAGSDSAFADLGTFDLQEYEANLELKLPVGFRQGHLAVRHAKMELARDRAVLKEQERQILHDLAATVAEVERSEALIESSLNRYLAATDALETLQSSQDAGMPVSFEQLLDAQRRVSESQTRYFQSLVEHAIAIKNVEFEKGTLLKSSDVMLIVDSPSY